MIQKEADILDRCGLSLKWGLNLRVFNTTIHGKLYGVPLNLLSSVYQ